MITNGVTLAEYLISWHIFIISNLNYHGVDRLKCQGIHRVKILISRIFHLVSVFFTIYLVYFLQLLLLS